MNIEFTTVEMYRHNNINERTNKPLTAKAVYNRIDEGKLRAIPDIGGRALKIAVCECAENPHKGNGLCLNCDEVFNEKYSQYEKNSKISRSKSK